MCQGPESNMQERGSTDRTHRGRGRVSAAPGLDEAHGGVTRLVTGQS